MNKKRRTILSIVIFVAFLVIAYFAYTALVSKYELDEETQSSDYTSSSELAKTAAKDFTVFDKEGNKVNLSDFKGTPIVLNFWASWCPPCKKELPDFNEVFTEQKDDVQFMMVDLTDGQQETQADGQGYVENRGFDFPVFFDKNQKAAIAYSIRYIPTTLFIDADGDIVKSYDGPISKEKLIAGIDLIK